MPKYDIQWQIFGVMYGIEADNEDHAREILEDEFFGSPDRDGLDYQIVLISE